MSASLGPSSRARLSRRHILMGGAATGLALANRARLAAQSVAIPGGSLFVAMPPAGPSLAAVDPSSGEVRFSFDIGPRPDAARATPLPGLALVRSEKSLAIVNATDGSILPVAVPQTILPDLLVKSIQFRGTAGQSKVLVGTPNFDADTWLIDLTTGERQAVIGLLGAPRPPV